MTKLIEIAVTPTVTVGAYSAKDVVGGMLTFANAASVYKGSGMIRKVTIKNNAMVADLLWLHLFNQSIHAIADNAAWAPTDAEMLTSQGSIPIVAADYVLNTDNAIATVRLEFPFVLVANGTSLFGQLSCVATPTYAAVGDVTVTLTIER